MNRTHPEETKYYKTLISMISSPGTLLSLDLLGSSLILLFLTTNAMQSCFIYKPIYTFCGFVQSLFNLDHKYYVLGCFYRIYNNRSLVFALILESLARGQQARRDSLMNQMSLSAKTKEKVGRSRKGSSNSTKNIKCKIGRVRGP